MALVLGTALPPSAPGRAVAARTGRSGMIMCENDTVLAGKLGALAAVTVGLPSGLRRLCERRMVAGHRAHGGRAFTGDWRTELAEELADACCYLGLGADRGLRSRSAALLLGLLWRLVVGVDNFRFSKPFVDEKRSGAEGGVNGVSRC